MPHPAQLGPDALAALLRRMADAVQADDSYSGEIAYHPTENTTDGDYFVRGTYRIGDSLRQGRHIFIEEGTRVADQQHLWEIVHPTYRAPLVDREDQYQRHRSWAALLDILDLIGPAQYLVYRWNWRRDLEEEERPVNELDLHVLHLLLGEYRCHTIEMRDSDEMSVRIWLAEQANRIAELWKPFGLRPRP